jgi:hypothetical protein
VIEAEEGRKGVGKAASFFVFWRGRRALKREKGGRREMENKRKDEVEQ